MHPRDAGSIPAESKISAGKSGRREFPPKADQPRAGNFRTVQNINPMNLKVLYEDNHLIAVYKPAGFLVQGDKSGKTNLIDKAKEYIKEKYKKPGNVFLGLLHRLDRPVSGIVLFAKTSKGAARLSEQFRNGSIKKNYHAVVVGRPPKKKDKIIHYLKKDADSKKALACKEQNAGCRRAELEYELLKTSGNFSFLKIKPASGRFHQIRFQLAAIGCPIASDRKYGADKNFISGRNIALSATGLSFKLATKNEWKNISIPVPLEWKRYFSN